MLSLTVQSPVLAHNIDCPQTIIYQHGYYVYE